MKHDVKSMCVKDEVVEELALHTDAWMPRMGEIILCCSVNSKARCPSVWTDSCRVRQEYLDLRPC